MVHATGCLLFALAFGPALMHSVQRFTRRLQIRWVPAERVVPLVLAATIATGGSLAWLAGQPSGTGAGALGVARAAVSPAQYLLAAQNRDGGFGPAPGQPSAQLYAGWAALGLAAAGYNVSTVAHSGRSVLAYVARAGAAAGRRLARTDDPGRRGAAGLSVTELRRP